MKSNTITTINPDNPYLADTPWPMGHQNPHQSAFTQAAGPVGPHIEVIPYADNPRMQTCVGGFVHPNGSVYARTSQVNPIVNKIFRLSPDLDYEEDHFIPFGLSGLVDRDGFLYTGAEHRVVRTDDVIDGTNLQSTPRLEGRIAYLNILPDGNILAQSISKGLRGQSKGKLYVIARRPQFEILSSFDMDETGSNGFSITQDGLVFALTEEALWKLIYDADTHKLSRQWRIDYLQGDPNAASGTTPTIVGDWVIYQTRNFSTRNRRLIRNNPPVMQVHAVSIHATSAQAALQSRKTVRPFASRNVISYNSPAAYAALNCAFVIGTSADGKGGLRRINMPAGPAGQLEKGWFTQLDAVQSVPCVSGDSNMVYVQFLRNGAEWIGGFDVHTGEEIWAAPTGSRFAPAPGPFIGEGGRLYSCSFDGIVMFRDKH